MVEQESKTLHILKDYKLFISEVDEHCRRIVQRHADQIGCTKGCAGNCCRIHLSVYPVEAVSMALALQNVSPKLRQRIQDRARQTDSYGPCPLLEERACLMYDARVVICRTHGLPVRSEYNGHRSVGYCIRNFKRTDPFSEADMIDLASLNRSLAEINFRFVHQCTHLPLLRKRYTIAEAMLLPLKG